MEKGSAMLDNVGRSIDDIHGRLDVALDTATKTVNNVDGLVTAVKPDIKQMAGNGSQITGTVNDLVSDLNAGKGPAGMLLKDAAAKRQLQATVSNAQQASLKLSEASARAIGLSQICSPVTSRRKRRRLWITRRRCRSI
jgi:predicted lipoprotein